jgi:single-strand DNA-binding protein
MITFSVAGPPKFEKQGSMAGNINKVILIGHLGCDPTMANAQSVEHAAQAAGEIVVSFSLLTTESWVDRKSGVRRKRTEWHHIAIFNQQLAEMAFRYLRKESKVYIEGQIQTRLLEDQTGQQRATTEIVLSRHRGELMMLDSRLRRSGATADLDAELARILGTAQVSDASA